MKFFHVYNHLYFDGLVKNNLINKDTGFKIQHKYAVPPELKFNEYAKVGGTLHSLIKEADRPFYIDRVAGGTTYHTYEFDKALVKEYANMLGDWFLGFQLHESASNRNNDWNNIARYMNGAEGPFDLEELRKKSIRPKAIMPDGTVLSGFAQGTPEEYAPMKRATSVTEFIAEIENMFKKYMKMTDGYVLPCDSYYLFTNMQAKLGMRTFMPEVGCQIGQMRVAVALARGMAKTFGKTWGTYYESWMESPDHKYTMACFNNDPGNEWYADQAVIGDDFSSYGPNGGSSRYLQKRIYYYSFMSGADYMAEEWGLNCSYNSMVTFELSPYGEAKKDFIGFTQTMGKVKATVPFAIVLPSEYACVEVTDISGRYERGLKREKYMQKLMSAEERRVINHTDDVLGFIYGRENGKIYGTEGHTIANSRFGDLFDIIYEDAPESALKEYTALIDASYDGGFATAKKNAGYNILTTGDLDKLELEIKAIAKQTLPCTVDSLCWLLSTDECGKRFVTVLNNEGNNRNLETGDDIIREADAEVTVTFKEPSEIRCIKHGFDAPKITKKDNKTYVLTIPAAGYAVFEY